MGNPKNPYEGRWRWWYDGIADWMIRNPQGKLQDCAKELDKAVNTISMIINTDMFKDHLAKRKAAWHTLHDQVLKEKLTKVANDGLDALLHQVKDKGRSVPMAVIAGITTDALDRLGYAPQKGPAVAVNIQNNTTTVVPNVTAQQLQEARLVIRAVEQQRITEVKEAAPQAQHVELLPIAPPEIDTSYFADPKVLELLTSDFLEPFEPREEPEENTDAAQPA